MVLPPSAANDASGPATPGWLRRLKVSLGLSSAGLLVLVDHARPERLGELVRALLPIAPELEVHTEVHRLAEARPGSTLVLVPREEDADWLNINRPLFASRALRVVLFCTREVSVALSRRAVDFLDWVSLRLECPAGPAPYAVAGLRLALAARVPGIVWTGGDLEASFAAARPRRVLRRISAAMPYEELVAEAKAAGPREWLAWTDVDGDFRLRRVRWALAEARRRTRAILVEPAVRSPGWWEVHGRVAEPAEACGRLRSAGAKHPGRLAALVDLEPEAIELLSGLLEHGADDRALEGELLKGVDPGAAVGRLAAEHGLVAEKEQVRGRAPPPAVRAFGAEPTRMRRLRGAELEAIEQRASRGEAVHPEDAAWWSSSVGTLPAQERLGGFGARGDVAEALLRRAPRTSQTWEWLISMAVSAGDMEVARVWTQHMGENTPARWKALAQVLSAQGRLAEAESLLRRQLTTTEPTSAMDLGWALHELGYVLYWQGRYSEAEKLLRQSLDRIAQSLGPQHPSYSAALQSLAMVLERRGQHTEAEKLLHQSLAIIEQSLGPHSHDYSAPLHTLAMMLQKQGRYAEAEKLHRQSLAIIEQTRDPQHPAYGAALHELAGVLEKQGRYAEAEKLLRQSLAVIKQALGPHHPDYGTSLGVLAGVLRRQARDAEAEELLRQSLAIKEQTLGVQHTSYGASLHALAGVLQKQGKYVEAEKLLRQSLTIVEQSLGPRHPQLCPTLANLGSNLTSQGRPQEGESFLLRAVDIALQAWGLQHPETAQVLSLLAQTQYALKKPEALTTARQAMVALVDTLGAEHPITMQSLPGLRHILTGSG